MISARTFRGGIHPLHSSGEGKRLTAALPVEPMTAPKTVCIPMAQHIGAPCVPCVAVGEHVKRGQKIGQTRSFVSAPVHASISGTVTEIAPHLVVGGNMVTCVTIENDFADEWAEECLTEPRDLDSITAEEALNAVLEGGLVGMGGAAFPAHVKLSPPKDKKIDTLVINGAECEPYLTCDYRIMLERAEEVADGILLLARALGAEKVLVGVEDNKPDAAETLRALGKFSVVLLKTKYPQGAEKQLIYALTKRKVPDGGLPMDVGCVVSNIQTALATSEACRKGKPLYERVLTVSGGAVAHPKNLLVPTGTSCREVVDFCGGVLEEPVKIISGGPMMGFAMFDYHVPVTKTTSALLVLTKDEVSRSRATACINCGRCVSECPEHLLPTKLATFAEHRKEEAFVKYNGMECCECGCCSYVCPAKRPLVQEIRSMRKMVMANRKKK